jgi:signal transduction histidine kinase
MACAKKSPEPANTLIPLSDKALSDSLGRLDSLVHATENSKNDLSKYYAKQALSIALRMNSEDILARAFRLMGVAYFNHNYDSSFIYFSKALKIANKNNLGRSKSDLYYSLAMIYKAAYDDKMAVIFLDSSIVLAQRFKEYQMISNAYNALGNSKFDLQESSDARNLYDSAYNIAKRHSLPKQLGVAMASLSRFETNAASSAKMQKEAVSILMKQNGNDEEIALILCNLGLTSSNPDTAINYYQTALKFAESAKSDLAKIAAYNNLAYSYLDKKKFKDAEESLIYNAIPIAVRLENDEWLSSLYDSYTDVLIAQKQIDTALVYARKALHAHIEADKKRSGSQVRLLAALFDVKNKELKIQTNEKELEKKENKIQMVILCFSAFVLVFLFVLFFITWKLQRNKIRYQANQLASAKRLIESEENLKGRVSMELHDLTTPFYSTMHQQIEEAQIQDQKIEKKLKDNLSVMTKSIRQMSHRMSSNFIEQLTIVELVSGLCEDLKTSSAIPIHYKFGQESFNLSAEKTIHIYRIIQEILTNAIKHVSFGEITLSLSEEAGIFFILYKDTGPGFDTKTATKKGLGVMNIFERAKIIGGNAVLNTIPGGGTKWNISVPLDKD